MDELEEADEQPPTPVAVPDLLKQPAKSQKEPESSPKDAGSSPEDVKSSPKDVKSSPKDAKSSPKDAKPAADHQVGPCLTRKQEAPV